MFGSMLSVLLSVRLFFIHLLLSLVPFGLFWGFLLPVQTLLQLVQSNRPNCWDGRLRCPGGGDGGGGVLYIKCVIACKSEQ